MRNSPLADDFACEGDDGEIDSLVRYCEMGLTPETRTDMTACIALGIASSRADIEPEAK